MTDGLREGAETVTTVFVLLVRAASHLRLASNVHFADEKTEQIELAQQLVDNAARLVPPRSIWAKRLEDVRNLLFSGRYTEASEAADSLAHDLPPPSPTRKGRKITSPSPELHPRRGRRERGQKRNRREKLRV